MLYKKNTIINHWKSVQLQASEQEYYTYSMKCIQNQLWYSLISLEKIGYSLMFKILSKKKRSSYKFDNRLEADPFLLLRLFCLILQKLNSTTRPNKKIYKLTPQSISAQIKTWGDGHSPVAATTAGTSQWLATSTGISSCKLKL